MAVGLGNSGEKYALTRHNAGRIALCRFAAKAGAQFKYSKFCRAHFADVPEKFGPLKLCFTDGFMNESGVNLKAALKFAGVRIDECVVLYDDITLDCGRIKLAASGSSGGHNGIADIIAHCGEGFARLKIGIGARPDKRMDLAHHVLGVMREEELAALFALDDRIAEALVLCAKQGVAKAQNSVNRAPEKERPENIDKNDSTEGEKAL